MKTLKQITELINEEAHKEIHIPGYGRVEKYETLHGLALGHAEMIHNALKEGKYVPHTATDLLHNFNITLNRHRDCCGPNANATGAVALPTGGVTASD